MSYIPFTEQQREQARRTDLVAFLRQCGEKVKRSGSENMWLDHGQKVTIRDNLWFHQYEQAGGDAIDFACRFYNMEYPEAVQLMLAMDAGTIRESVEPFPQKPLEIPQKHENMRRVYGYLLRYRGIDKEVLRIATQFLIYEIVCGLRDPATFKSNSVNSCGTSGDIFYNAGEASVPYFAPKYNALVDAIHAAKKIPSFTGASVSSAPTITLTGEETSVTDSNGVLSNFSFMDGNGAKFYKSGNTLYITQTGDISESTVYKEDLLYKALNVQIDRECYCQKADLRFLEDVNLKHPKSMAEFETLWYNGDSRRNVHYDYSRYHALNLHSVFSNTAIPSEMPAQVFDIGCPGSAGAIGFVLAGNL